MSLVNKFTIRFNIDLSGRLQRIYLTLYKSEKKSTI